MVGPERSEVSRLDLGPGRSSKGCSLLRRCVARRDSQPKDVGAGAGVPLRDGGGELGDLGTEHRLGADDPPHRCESAGVVRRGRPRHDVAVDVLAGEPHLDPDSRCDALGHRGGDGVVEGPVEVRQRYVDEHPRDRVYLGDLDGCPRFRTRLGSR